MSHPLHPIIVHFPIALLITAILFEVLELVLKQDFLRKASTWLLGLGFLGGLVATATGVLAEEAAEDSGVPESAIELHESLAFATLGAFALMIAIRWLQRKRNIPHNVLLAVGLIGVALLGLTGYFGGDLVYRYGAGVDRAALTSKPAAESASPHEVP